jgi:hypothetical protein
MSEIIDDEALEIIQWDDAPLRMRIFHIFDRYGVEELEEPAYIAYVRWVTLVFMMLFIIMCNVSILVSSLPQYERLGTPNPFTTVNFICVVYFTFEYGIRFLCAPRFFAFFFDTLNMLDILTVLPFYLNQGDVVSTGITNWILILRSIRLIRDMFFFHNFDIVANTIGESSEVAALMLIIMVIGLPLGGTCIHYAERGTWNTTATPAAWYRECFPPDPCVTERSPFQSAIDGMWYFIITSLTVGYGDVVPTTRAGKLMGGTIMVVGVMLLAYPIMILAVNFEEERRKEEREKTLGKVANGERLRILQKMNTEVLQENEEDAFDRPLPIYFYPQETNLPRQLILINAEEVRYDPLFYVQRNRDGSLYMLQSVKTSLEVTIRLMFDTSAAQRLALQTIREYTEGEADIEVKRARFFPVVRMYLRLDIPPNQCEFLKRIRLVNQVVDNMDLDTMRMPVAIELNGFDSQLDEQRKLDFHQALHRCRLHVTAMVAYDDPIFYDVPIFLGMLGATALIRELQAKQQGVVYVTTSQIESLLNGVHHLIDLNATEPSIIINTRDIVKSIAKAITLRAASQCEDPTSLKDEAFLYGRVETTEPYHGVFVKRLAKKKVRGNDGEVTLCNVKVLAVQARQSSMTLIL